MSVPRTQWLAARIEWLEEIGGGAEGVRHDFRVALREDTLLLCVCGGAGPFWPSFEYFLRVIRLPPEIRVHEVWPARM